jgi:hypothetical protein
MHGVVRCRLGLNGQLAGLLGPHSRRLRAQLLLARILGVERSCGRLCVYAK